MKFSLNLSKRLLQPRRLVQTETQQSKKQFPQPKSSNNQQQQQQGATADMDLSADQLTTNISKESQHKVQKEIKKTLKDIPV